MTATYGSSGSFGSIVRSNLSDITHIQAEEVIYIKNQHQFMDLFKNII